MKVSEFQYDLPESAISQSAIEPRHESRLLDARDLSDHRFLDLPNLLEPGDLLVVNDTRVRAARLVGRRSGTGGKVELLLLSEKSDGLWEALARPARRLRPGVRIDIDGLIAVVRSDPAEGIVLVSFDTDDPESAIASVGSVPLPPYFTGDLDDPDRYQTLFARELGSSAAPTAGLHFTDLVVDRLRARDIRIAAVDLHVSLDTFRPMSAELVEDHKMRSEWCSVPKETADLVSATRRQGGRVVAVGTTVVRTLESFADGSDGIESGSHHTDLFLRPGMPFQVVDGLVTNFHMPGSTLLVLIAAFMGPSWRELYQAALERGYRFLSFGDSMYAERADS